MLSIFPTLKFVTGGRQHASMPQSTLMGTDVSAIPPNTLMVKDSSHLCLLRKKKLSGEGLLNLTRDVQAALGDDKLLIGKVPNQPFVKAAQIEVFIPNNRSINELLSGADSGQVIEAHKAGKPPGCSGDLTDVIAAFLIAASENCYFGCGNWNTRGNDTDSLTWRKEYDMPLGEPLGPATYQKGVWMRQFKRGTKVTFDTSTNKGSIQWGKND